MLCARLVNEDVTIHRKLKFCLVTLVQFSKCLGMVQKREGCRMLDLENVEGWELGARQNEAWESRLGFSGNLNISSPVQN